MNGIEAVLDTNIFIYQLFGKSDVEEYFVKFRPLLSFITELKLLSGGNFSAQEFDIAKRLVNKYPIIEFDSDMKDIIFKIRTIKKIKLADAIIAATAMYLKCPLISSDKGFSNIEGLDFIYHEPTLS